jgi:hypothetical protein
VKFRTELTVEQKKRIVAEQVLALKGPELRACQKALAAARTDKEWEDLWSERRPDKSLQLKDALSKSSSSSDEEEEESSQQEGNLAAAFLKGLKKGQGQPAKREEKEKIKEDKKDLEAEKKPSKACKKAQAEKDKLAMPKEADAKWNKKLEEATQVGESEKDSKVKKMLSMVPKAAADMKKACKKATDTTWGATELTELAKSRDDLEEFSTETDLNGVKDKLLEAAAALKQLLP